MRRGSKRLVEDRWDWTRSRSQKSCGDARPAKKRPKARTNPHSCNGYRVNGVVSKMTEFASALVFKPGQPMVRAHACRMRC